MTINQEQIKDLLQAVQSGTTTIEKALERLKQMPYEDLEFARLDHHRQIRRGFPEVIFCPGKAQVHIVKIFKAMVEKGGNVLATRAEMAVAQAVQEVFPEAQYDEHGRTLSLVQDPVKPSEAILPIITAGTADLPVAREAQATAKIMGQKTELICDVGVAGLHRLLDCVPRLQAAPVLIVVAGMEGALASVVAGLVNCPIIAVPTSVGYGSSFNGLSALLTMLNSCACGVSVVNIDNGFSAAMSATMINRKIEGRG